MKRDNWPPKKFGLGLGLSIGPGAKLPGGFVGGTWSYNWATATFTAPDAAFPLYVWKTPWLPKGCNNNALRDTDDTSVLYQSDGYSNCGKTGSGVPFAKTTHNGQTCGVADLNGLMYEISLGITCIVTTAGIEGLSVGNPCEVTWTGHGLDTGAVVMIIGITQADWANLKDKLYTITKTGDNTFTLNGVNTSTYAAYDPGTDPGTIHKGNFYAAKEATAMKDFTSGNTEATDHWGAVGVAAMMEALAVPLLGANGGSAFAQRFGSGANQVLSAATSGANWLLTGLGLPQNTSAFDATGTDTFGKDYYYLYLRNELCLLSCAIWSGSSFAGVWAAYLYSSRTDSNYNAGWRCACYPTYTTDLPSDIGKYGVGVCPAAGLPSGMVGLTGYNVKGHANYGNYQYGSSIFVFIPRFYYKVGTGPNGLAVNTVDIKGVDTYATTAAANAAGYALPRAFIDGGQEHCGFFIFKYKSSKVAQGTGWICGSVANGLPLSAHADHNPMAQLTASGGTNAYYKTIDCAHAIDGENGAVNPASIFHVASRFQLSALALFAEFMGYPGTPPDYSELFCLKDYGTQKAIAANLTTSGGCPGGVVTRYSDNQNWVAAYHDGTNAALVKCVAGVRTTLIDSAAGYAAGRTVEVRWAAADSAQLYYNGAQVGANQDVSAVPAGTKAGVFGTSSVVSLAAVTAS